MSKMGVMMTQQRFYSFWIGLLVLFLSACGASPENIELATEHAAVGTQVAELRATDSVENARLLTTVDFVSTQVAYSSTQSSFLKSTLIARGTPESALNTFRDQMIGSLLNPPTQTPTATVDPTQQAAAMQPQPIETTAPVTVEPTRPIVTMNYPTSQPSPTELDPNRVALIDSVTSTGVGNDDCPVGATSQFSPNTPEIYVVTTVRNAPANTRFTSRWFAGENEVAVFDYTPDFEIDGSCIWFFVDETDFPFTSGEYRVQLEVNGEITAGPLPFTITGG